MEKSIPLSEKLYMLGVNPRKSGILMSVSNGLNYSMIGALLMELYINKNIKFENKKVFLINPKTENELHSLLIEKINNANKPQKISGLVNKFAFKMKTIRKHVQRGLVDKRIIRLKQKRFLFIKWNEPVLINKQVVFRVINHIETCIAKGTNNEEDLILLSLIQPSGLLTRIYKDRQKRKQAKIRLKKMMVENQVSKAVSDAITAAQMVAATVAISAATTAATR